MDGLPPEWDTGLRVTCPRPEPHFYLENREAPVDYHIELLEDRGELTPIPMNGDDASLEPTSQDYFRRYRVTAAVDCEENELPCEGTWRLDVIYDQPRDRVRWLYTDEE